MNKKILFLLITIFLFSLTSVFAITWRHDGIDTMTLDDNGNLFVLSNVTADFFVGDGDEFASGLPEIGVPLIHEDLQFIHDGLERNFRNHSTTALQILAAWHITI